MQENQPSNPTPPGAPSGYRVGVFSHETPINRGGRDPNASVGGRMPALGDVVSCFFPEDERPNHPGIKARPCLVLGCQRSQNDVWWVKVAYGTTQRPGECRTGEFSLVTPESLRAAGLHHPTKFVTNRCKIVQFSFAFFRANRAGSVFLGALAAEDRARAQQAMEQAQRDRQMREQRRQQRSREYTM